MNSTPIATSTMSQASSAGASCVGREHLRLGRNNQDGWWLEHRGARAVGVVTDGCGSQPHSEIGAQLGARFLCTWLTGAALSDELPLRAAEALTAWLYRTALEFGPEQVNPVLERSFLFTFLAAVREGPEVQVFGLGDGAVWIDGQLTVLDPGPQNAPEYCAYRLGDARRPAPTLHFRGAAAQVALMTDGFEELLTRDAPKVGTLFEDRAAWKNPLTLQRRLNVLAENERLADDATLIVV
jgi:hypothetical protein